MRGAFFKSLILFLSVFSGIAFRVAGQSRPEEDDKPLRIEISSSSDQETYRLVAMGQTGVLLFFRSNEKVSDSLVKWYFSLYDRELRQQWIKSIPVPSDLDFRNSCLLKDTLCLGFYYSGKEKESLHPLMIIRLAVKTATFIGNRGILRESADLADLEIKKNHAIITYNLKNEPARMTIINLSGGSFTDHAMTEDTVSYVMTVETDTLYSRLLVAIRKMVKKNTWEVFLQEYSFDGKKISETLISAIDAGTEIQNTRFYPLDEKNILIVGSYGPRTTSKKSTPPQSAGFFLTRVQDHQQKDIHFFNFLELRNAGNLLGERDVMALKKKSMKKNRDLNAFSLDFNLFLHPILPVGDQFLVIAETFYPQYHSENFTDFDFYGRPFTNSYNIFDGYRFSNAIAASFSKDGQLVWDNTMEIRNLLTFDLAPRVQVCPSGNNLILAYLSEGKIATKMMNKDKVVEKLDFSPLELMFPEDKLLEETRSRMVAWYGNYYLCYGYQQIKNINRSEGSKRLVFYFTKVQFE